MDVGNVVESLGLFASGGAITKIIEAVFFREATVSKSWREYAEKMEERVDELEKKYDTLSKEHAALQKELISLLSKSNEKKTDNNNSRSRRKGNRGGVQLAG